MIVRFLRRGVQRLFPNSCKLLLNLIRKGIGIASSTPFEEIKCLAKDGKGQKEKHE